MPNTSVPANDTAVTGDLDQHVIETKPETERSVAFVEAGHHRLRRVDFSDRHLLSPSGRPKYRKECR